MQTTYDQLKAQIAGLEGALKNVCERRDDLAKRVTRLQEVNELLRGDRLREWETARAWKKLAEELLAHETPVAHKLPCRVCGATTT
jgi:hypothetical protein